MARLSQLLFWSAAALITQTLAEIDCEGSVTILNSTVAKQVGKKCKTIQGDLVLPVNISESINLDGLEEVKGDFRYNDCSRHKEVSCPKDTPLFNISSSTLETVGRDLDLQSLLGLESLSFPKLNTVKRFLNLTGIKNTTSIDLTKLENCGVVSLDGPQLTDLKMDGLQHFTNLSSSEDFNNFISLDDVEHLKSIDAFYENPMDPMGLGVWKTDDDVKILGTDFPQVRHVTFGWKRAKGLIVGGDDIGLTFGGPLSESMELGSFSIQDQVKSLQRGPKMKNLTVGSFEFASSNNMTGDLVLPFDQLSSAEIQSFLLDSVQLTAEAENWTNTSLSIALFGGSGTPATGKNQAGEKTWYWPKHDIKSLSLYMNMTNDFFTDFINGNTRVTDYFEVRDDSNSLDCKIFLDIKDRLPSDYLCAHGSGGRILTASQSLLLCAFITSALSFIL